MVRRYLHYFSPLIFPNLPAVQELTLVDQIPPKQPEPSQPVVGSTMWVIAYRKYLRFWVNLAKTVGASDEEAEDLVHNVISSVLSEPSKEFDSLEHLRNYVAKAVLNRAIQAKRRSNRRETWTESIEVQFAVSPETLESEETQKMRTLREGIDRLSRNEYEIVKLRFYFGLTFREISEKLDVPISTLKSREDAAVKKIRVHLRKKGF